MKSEIDRWMEVGRRLREINPERYRTVLQLGLAYLAAFEEPGEPDAVFSARLAFLGGGKVGAA